MSSKTKESLKNLKQRGLLRTFILWGVGQVLILVKYQQVWELAAGLGIGLSSAPPVEAKIFLKASLLQSPIANKNLYYLIKLD